MFDVHRISENDIEALASLEAEIFPDAWSAKSIKETYEQKHALILGGYNKGTLTGYVIFYYVLDEGEIARIAVSPLFRKQGVAQALLKALLKFCAEKEITRIMLDVRMSNDAAILFYRKSGFTEDGIRKSFYENPKEDALLMSIETAS